MFHNRHGLKKNAGPMNFSWTGEMDENVIIQSGILNGTHKVTMLNILSLVSITPTKATTEDGKHSTVESESVIEVLYPLKGTNKENCTESLLKKFPSNYLAKVLLSHRADNGFSIKLAANDKSDEYMLNDRLKDMFQADQKGNEEEEDSLDGDLSWDDLLYGQGCLEIIFKRIGDRRNDGSNPSGDSKIGMNGNGQQNELECSPSAEIQKMMIGYRFVRQLS
ncbi:hypothetical protein V865_005826 [Kwoniella europaea PYCC6329]|uniref:PITH domain-containing protein n=1 Tax=Kwoniella europaea PYCC6329 TaxID=1423913 RepID=A0AAX4KP37_9TREE